MGAKHDSHTHQRVNLLQKNLACMEFLRGDRLYPCFSFDKVILEKISSPWKNALVVKLLGKDLGFLVMRDRLKKMWNPFGGFDIIDLGFGFFLIKFDEEEDRANVVKGGHGCCLIIIYLFEHGLETLWHLMPRLTKLWFGFVSRLLIWHITMKMSSSR